MALRFYLVPKVLTQDDLGDLIVPKYVHALSLSSGVLYSALDYQQGVGSAMLVACDVTGAQHAAIVANADAMGAPVNLQQAINANLATVQAALEAFEIPSGWVTSGMTFAALLRWVARLFVLARRIHGRSNGRLLPQGITLNSTVGELTVAQRTALSDAADSLGLSTSGITVATTIRQTLKTLIDQIDLPVGAGGVTL